MKLVQSKWFGDCGVCCAAMITDQSHLHVCENTTLRTHRGAKYLGIPEMFAYFAANDILCGLAITALKGFQGDEDALVVNNLELSLDQDALVTVDSSTEGFLHYVVWDGAKRKFLDPNINEPQDVDGYDIREWWPIQRFEKAGVK